MLGREHSGKGSKNSLVTLISEESPWYIFLTLKERVHGLTMIISNDNQKVLNTHKKINTMIRIINIRVSLEIFYFPAIPASLASSRIRFIQFPFSCLTFEILDRVVRKPVNVNPRLNVDWSIFFSCLKVFFTSNVWFSLRLLQLKTEGQTI